VSYEIAFAGAARLVIVLLSISCIYQTADGRLARRLLFSLGRAVVVVFGLSNRRFAIFSHQGKI
jgi:hypothetical protein